MREQYIKKQRIKILENGKSFPAFDFDKVGDTVIHFKIEGLTRIETPLKIVEIKEARDE